jgi:hypothetical protein
MILHILILYGACCVSLAATAYTFGLTERPLFPYFWPFLILGSIDTLTLNANGHLVVEWLLPLLTMTIVAIFSRSKPVVLWVRRGLLIATIFLIYHGWCLLSEGYVTRPVALTIAKKTVGGWYTPLTGFKRIDQ